MNGELDTAAPGDTGADADHDGYVATLYGGDDCDDTNASVRPGATELCNLIDDNCDGTADEGCPRTLDDRPTGDGLAWTCSTGLGNLGVGSGLLVGLAFLLVLQRRRIWRAR